MFVEPRIQLTSFILSLSEALDLISPKLTNHQKRVAYIGIQVATEMGLENEVINDILYAGALHDIALCSAEDKEHMMKFEVEDPAPHMVLGHMMLKNSEAFSMPAEIIRYHHLPWDEGRGEESEGMPVPLSSHIIHLADRVEVLIHSERNILAQVENILKTIKRYSGSKFVPAAVKALESLSKKESFWLDIISPRIYTIMMQLGSWPAFVVGIDELEKISKIFAQVIDFKSPWTATHSTGVAACSEMLARRTGFSERESRCITIAGHLHDLGKLSIPVEILDKPAKLDDAERRLIRGHTYHTYHILSRIQDMSDIARWGAFHHEKLDGSGYPFHLHRKDLPLGARIVGVADIFTAITEDRPYRKSMPKEKVLAVLSEEANSFGIDREIVDLLFQNYDEIDSYRIVAQKRAKQNYEEFSQEGKRGSIS